MNYMRITKYANSIQTQGKCVLIQCSCLENERFELEFKMRSIRGDLTNRLTDRSCLRVT